MKDLNVQYIIDESGERSGVILSIEDFEALVEDLEDLAIVAERRDEPTISHEELKANLRKDGRLPDLVEELRTKGAQEITNGDNSENCHEGRFIG